MEDTLKKPLENSDMVDYEGDTCGERFRFHSLLGLKIGSLVVFTYGLMFLMFYVCMKLETQKGSISQSFQYGGLIILDVFVAEVVFWGILWAWGSSKRDRLRREIVERQLAIIRKKEQEQEEKDLQQERMLIERRKMQGK